MNALLSVGVKDTPTHIFNHFGRGLVESRITNAITNSITGQAAVDEETLAAFALRYHLLSVFLDQQILDKSWIARLVHNPHQAINVVALKPNLLPQFEELILAAEETTEQLFNLLRRSRPGVTSRDEYLQSLLERVRLNPVRWLRMFSSIEDNQRSKAAIQEISRRALAEENRFSSPWWALHYLRITAAAETTSLEPRLVAALSQDEEAAFRAARVLRDRLAIPDAWDELLKALREPRWLYHALRHGLFVQDEQRAAAEQSLAADPGWLVEYIVDCRIPVSQVDILLTSSANLAPRHELSRDLLDWRRTLTFARTIRLGAGQATGLN